MLLSRRGFLVASGSSLLATWQIAATAGPAGAVMVRQSAPENADLARLSGTTNDAAPAIRSYLSGVSGSVTLSGDYVLDSVVEVPRAVTSLQLTAGTKLKVRGDHGALSRSGTIVYRDQLSTAMETKRSSITVDKPTKYVAGEYLLLAGDDAIPAARDRYGYLRRITSVSGSTVNIDKALPRAIRIKPRTALVTLAPSLKLWGSGEIFHLTPSLGRTPLVSFFAVDNPRVSGIDIHDNGATGVLVAHCKGGLIDCTIHDLLDDGETYFGYGVNVTGSTRAVVVRGTMTRVRHAVTTNSGPGIDVMGSAGEPEDCWFEPVAISCSDKSVDTHCLGWNTTIVPHITGGHGGVQVRADNTTIIGGEITGCSGPGISVNPLVAIAPRVSGTIIRNLKPSGTAILADSAIVATDIVIQDCYGTHIVLQSDSTVTSASIVAGGAIGVSFRGSNNTVTNIALGANVTTPFISSAGANNNIFTRATTAPTPLPASVNTAPPTISGTVQVGEQLSVTDGSWTVGPMTPAFTWRRNGVALSNATERTYHTYDVVSADAGAVLTVEVVVRRAGYQDGRAMTAGTVPVALGAALTPTTKPVLSGTAKPGQTLTVTRGVWSPAAQSTSCAWSKNGVPSGDTGTTYLVKTSDVGKTITATVTAKRTGYATATFAPTGKKVSA
ncbi:right-handed parallel beta-helix repeat-containing protein [Subtercola boreus]|uniref:right-handed parallel beta-helix repeat-containing protein n=1 Tax=Subtercola boreus TaxID=120213 RepID=UPI0015586FB0|nr:right-handed parallel beta-helix repeat-containing protein [Subtercola boreus]